MMGAEYSEGFFEALREGSSRSAAVIVPLVVDLVRPRSVVDIGCGTGGWLATFAQHGVAEYLGIDGFTPAGLLEIPRDRFMEADLTQPLAVGRCFDLAVCLEVAEHLPESAADGFVDSLTRLAPVVLFSAAIPGQEGTAHLNEQWPEYWSHLFAAKGFRPIDILRPRIWHDEGVEVWYAQNTILYVARASQDEFPGLRRAAVLAEAPLAIVHPRLFAEHHRRLRETIRSDADARVEVARLRDMLATERQQSRAEIEGLNVELARCRFRAEPRNMSLRSYVQALPRVVRGALRRRVRRAR
jgi:SAM-dependent methyltransferase